MPITGTPTTNSSAPAITRDEIRMFLRDYAQNNILLDDVQFKNEELDMAMNLAVDEYNVLTPISGASASSIPKSLLMLGTASWLMKTESFLQIRNQASYQDADIQPIGVDDKHGLYLQFSRTLKEDWLGAAKAYKQQLNLESVYGGISSGYINVGRFHNT